MTDSDDKLLQRYRALSREEPPRALDDAILAASRRAVAARPALSRRWAAPVSIAAVLVLAFGVTLEMQREEPGIEYLAPKRTDPRAAPVESPKVEAPAASVSERKFEAPASREGKAPAMELRRAVPPALRKATPSKEAAPATQDAATAAKPVERVPQAFAPSPPARPMPAAPPAPAPVPQMQAIPVPETASMDRMRDANVAPAPASGAPAASGATAATAASRAKVMSAPAAKAERAEAERAPSRAFAAPSEPERELERIAKLREDGRNDEADKALDAFRRKYPDFRIVEPMWSRVMPR